MSDPFDIVVIGGAGGLVVAMKANLKITLLSATIHVYPTLSQGVKKAADQYFREKLFTGWFPKLARWLIRF